MKALFLVNARSGGNRRRDVGALIRSTCGWKGFEVQACEGKHELDDRIAEASAAGFDAIIAVGGDGTVHEVAKRLIGSPMALGVIPTGSGNGLARHVGIPMNPRDAVVACGDAQVTEVDTGEVNGLAFIGTMGLGFDAWVAHEFATHPGRGPLTYLRAAAGGFFAYLPETYDVERDGRTTRHEAFVLTIANSGQYGNNARIAPGASMTDGELDLVIVRRGALASLPLLATRLFTGSMHRSSAVATERVVELTIRRAAPGPAHLDGEPVHLPAELHIRVRPRSLRVLLPRGVKRI
jgi:diacylglycerol kinase (ATP)